MGTGPCRGVGMGLHHELLYCLDLSCMGSVVHIDLRRSGLVKLIHEALCYVTVEVLVLFDLYC